MIWTRSLLIVVLVAGCATRPDQQIFVLGSETVPIAGTRDNTGRRLIELKPVHIPDYLDTTDILLRTGTNQLTASPTGIWGERLSVGITQALAEALRKQVPSAQVVSRPAVDRPAMQILVDITTLQVSAGGNCVMIVSWTLLRGDTGAPQTAVTAQGTYITPVEDRTNAAVVAAITRTIAQLAAGIVGNGL
jgi:uncharacterized lipoprotein YmbA